MDFTHILRPKNFDTIIGQEHLTDVSSPLRILCEQGVLNHSFFYGPAGSGKTSLARVIAKTMHYPFYEFNATSLKIENLRKIFDKYTNTLEKPLIFIDEVHRLAKNQQEVLLPYMENNTILLLGASTENPFFSLTPALRSRSQLFELHSISKQALTTILDNALEQTTLQIDQDAKNYIVLSSGGDARSMLKLLESLLHLQKPIDLQTVKSLRPYALQIGNNDKGIHYDLTSALIKSIRGSDPDAAVYYLARLIDGGENAEFIARRLVILASEDIGNANPQALTLTTSCLTSVGKIGYPEARIILSQAVVYLCASPKSNSSYLAINKALHSIKNGEILEIPAHIKQQNTNYLNPHNFGGYIKQSYLSKPLKFIELLNVGYEAKMAQWLKKITNFS